MALPGGFEPGDERRAMSTPGLRLSAPYLLQGAIFPGEVMPRRAEPDLPEFLLNITNDGWFGITADPTSISRRRAFGRSRGWASFVQRTPAYRPSSTRMARCFRNCPSGWLACSMGNYPDRSIPPIYARHPWSSVAVLFAEIRDSFRRSSRSSDQSDRRSVSRSISTCRRPCGEIKGVAVRHKERKPQKLDEANACCQNPAISRESHRRSGGARGGKTIFCNGRFPKATRTDL